MPWCPKCGTEYREGFDTCADCGEALAQALPERKSLTADNPMAGESALLTTAEDDTQAGMLSAMLESYGIPVKRIYLDSGGFMKVYSGKTVFGVELYVPQDCLEEAKALLETESFPEKETLPDSPEEDETAPSPSDRMPFSLSDVGGRIFDFVNGGGGKRRRIIAWLIVFPLIAGIVLSAVSILLYVILRLFAVL